MRKLSQLIENNDTLKNRMLIEADEPTELELELELELETAEPSPSGGNAEPSDTALQLQGQYLNKRDIKFTIWKDVDTKIQHLKDNNSYQRIEYKYINQVDKISISFLLGFNKSEKSWCLWVGKIGAVSYNDDPYYIFGTLVFNEAVLLSLNKIVRYVQSVKDDKDNWLQYYSE